MSICLRYVDILHSNKCVSILLLQICPFSDIGHIVLIAEIYIINTLGSISHRSRLKKKKKK